MRNIFRVIAKISVIGYISISDNAYFDSECKSAKMGRPSLNVKATLVRLPVETLERIDQVAGKNRRAVFIREAVEQALTHLDSQKSVESD